MGEENVHITQDENSRRRTRMSWASAIPMGIGAISSLFGKGKGKETEYTAQAPEYQQQFSEEFMKFLQGQIGQGATPYGGQVAASASNPFTQSALGLWGASPYGQFSGGAPSGGQPQMPMGQLGGGMMPQMPPQGQMGGGQAPGGQRPMPQQMPMQRPMPQRPPQRPQGGLGGGVPFRR